MLSIDAQLARGALVCPRTHEPLVRNGTSLVTQSGSARYALVGDVPILLDEERQKQYLAEVDGKMVSEYTATRRFSLKSAVNSILARAGDHRTFESLDALARVIDWQPDTALCLSIGGGPGRSHRQLVNLNIGLFPNVDIVSDAYALPYATSSVDNIHCEAVLEHLEAPEVAVAEMLRVLVPGGQLYAATPFLAFFHAYPNHFQNFTLIGHRRLFERAGFSIVKAGVCVGPTFAVSELVVEYIRGIAPSYRLWRGLSKLVALALLPLRSLDDYLSKQPHAFILASSTYVHAVKPAPSPT